MTKEEIKANELTERFMRVETPYEDSICGINPSMAKLCAIICVDEILKLEPPELSYLEPFSKSFWQSVKEILEKK